MDGDTPDLSFVDLFCGAGGLSLGLIRAGFRPLASYDSWEPAVRTYRANLGDHAHLTPITTELSLPASAVIVGGPPCQGFSSAGLRRAGDTRNSLVRTFAQAVVRYQPRAFIFENVEGFLTGGAGAFLFDLLEPVIGVGYRVHLRKVNAANYGVPQHRKRVIAIGGLGWDPPFPSPTHSAHDAPGAHLASKTLPPCPTLHDALLELPRAGQPAPPAPTDHESRPLSPADHERALRLAQGQTMRDLPEEFWHESYRRRAFRRVIDGTPSERRGGAPAGLRRLRWESPSKAVTSGAVSEFLHPVEHRTLTLRECARIQTFPDEFAFHGTRNERALLIGNAVPPRLAECIGRTLLYGLAAAGDDGVRRGKLLSFVPTLSEGTSPALESVTAKVHAMFTARAAPQEQMSLWR
jgi:DNA (cytosine-5)-methyltransferase 1